MIWTASNAINGSTDSITTSIWTASNAINGSTDSSADSSTYLVWTTNTANETSTNFGGWTNTTPVDVSLSPRGWIVVEANDVYIHDNAPLPLSPVAVRRAERLLRRILTNRQTRTWERWGFVDVPSSFAPGVVYRVPNEGFVTEFVQGRPMRNLCIYGLERLPPGDRMVALKCLIEAEEAEFLKTANVHALDSSHAYAPTRPRLAVPITARAARALPIAA